EQVADYLNAYAAEFDLPVRVNSRVTALTRTAEGFEARTDDGIFRARQVVVATGPFQAPHVPPAARRLDGCTSSACPGSTAPARLRPRRRRLPGRPRHQPRPVLAARLPVSACLVMRSRRRWLHLLLR